MKALIVVLALLSGTSCGAEPTDRDKVLHLQVSGTISALVFVTLRNQGASKTYSFWGAVGSGLIIGTMKEFSDERFDWSDMKYNAIGSVGIPLLLITF